MFVLANNDNIKSILRSEIYVYGPKCDLNHIDVSGVTNMSYLFSGVTEKKSIIDDGHHVTYYSNLLNSDSILSKFNGDISGWDVSNVQNMDSMFLGSKFNGDISGWKINDSCSFHDIFKSSYLEYNMPLWYLKYHLFKSNFENSIKIYEWIDFKRGIIWKKRLKYALEDYGNDGYIFPEKIQGFQFF